jgi:large subunit ribosomal protein L7/L12
MALSCRHAAQCCARQLRNANAIRASSSVLVQQRITRRHNSTEAGSAKITGIVDQISQLTLLETADLVASLKVHGDRLVAR